MKAWVEATKDLTKVGSNWSVARCRYRSRRLDEIGSREARQLALAEEITRRRCEEGFF
jgi:hypothetical protein